MKIRVRKDALTMYGVKSFIVTAMLLMMVGFAHGEATIIEKGVISKDTTWSGEVILKGDVEIAKGATLTVMPGTIVMCEKIASFGPEKLSQDKTHAFPRIEIIIRGSIIAKGTKEQMIFFTSISPTPSAGDWGAINMLDSTGNVIEYCDFSYAHTAVHAHSGEVTITNCYFHDNGVAVGSKNYKDFATKSVFTVENNRITGNGMGLLFGGGSVMNAQHNEISENKLFGIYAKKGSSKSNINNNNIVKNGKGILFWGVKAGFKIHANNIHDNTDYNLSLMEGTEADVDASGNWWGTTDEAAIKAMVRDKEEEKELGTAIIKGFAQSPIPGAGITN